MLRPIGLVAILCALIALPGCGSHQEDKSLAATCERVDLGLPNDLQAHKWLAYADLIDQQSSYVKPDIKAVLGSMSKDAQGFAQAPMKHGTRNPAWTQFWNDSTGLFQACKANGTPMKP